MQRSGAKTAAGGEQRRADVIELGERIAIAGIDRQGQAVVGQNEAVDIVGDGSTRLQKNPRAVFIQFAIRLPPQNRLVQIIHQRSSDLFRIAGKQFGRRGTVGRDPGTHELDLVCAAAQILSHVSHARRVNRRVGEILHLHSLGLQQCRKCPQSDRAAPQYHVFAAGVDGNGDVGHFGQKRRDPLGADADQCQVAVRGVRRRHCQALPEAVRQRVKLGRARHAQCGHVTLALAAQHVDRNLQRPQQHPARPIAERHAEGGKIALARRLQRHILAFGHQLLRGEP